MAETSLLDDFVAGQFPVGAEIGPDDIRNLLSEIGLGDAPSALTIEVEAAVREATSGSASLSFLPGGWRLHITDKATQTLLMGAILWGGLVGCGVATAIPAAIVGALVPSVFALERVKLTRGETEILAQVALRDSVRTGTPREVYDGLPEQIRSELNYFDFADFLQKVIEAGSAGETKDGKVEIYKQGERRFRLRLE